MTEGRGLTGRIIKGIGGFYYVHVPGNGIYSCRARGIFRKLKVKPLPGDSAVLEVIDERNMEGSIIEILPRINTLIRPAAANVDQAMIIFAVKSPQPNLNLLDRFLILMSEQNIDTIICFSKTDLAAEQELEELLKAYSGSGCRLLTVSVREKTGLEAVREAFLGKTTIIAGPSGVGKSSLTNALYPDACMDVGSVSDKILRGRHTTRHTELFAMGEDTYLMDTPGFSSIFLGEMDKTQLKYYYPEFEPYFESCRFNGCNHLNEPDCAVKAAVKCGDISKVRYENYRLFYDELAARKPF